MTGAITLAACASLDPEADFRALEARLLAAETVHVDFHATAEGALSADLSGALDLEAAGSVRLTADGDFVGESVTLRLLTDGTAYTFGNRTQRTRADRPPALEEALLVGFTRMGILHNLAMLVEAAAPDRADGGVREWVVVDTFAAGGADGSTLAFAITVAGKPAGTAELDLDPRGIPVERRQIVQFPNGEMRVVERYSAVNISP